MIVIDKIKVISQQILCTKIGAYSVGFLAGLSLCSISSFIFENLILTDSSLAPADENGTL